jgi:hypothetical protein
MKWILVFEVARVLHGILVAAKLPCVGAAEEHASGITP